ncbi:pentatricopeptide repeat-containing protein At4g02750 isoform X2 [Cryptomeria japonica]|uniref:pentatricopeptide repeat-containing protein At4g02750 isoform X2 n=1 Tax=Cryptomeria japonica TaxID=3369 RepID=UPI0027DA8DED|nr:pentatricopeptide repeat-containing protein At4g02750 isoform X2 [Cryptomeria japonica]
MRQDLCQIAYGKHGVAEASVKLFEEMQRIGIQPNQFTFASVLAACADLEDLKKGMRIHDEIVRLGFQSDTFVASALLDMYSKCGSIEKARKLFDNMNQRDVVSWTAMIAGYAHNGFLDEALALFKKMPEHNVVSWNAMIAGYAQNGYVEEALILFQKMPQRNVVSWTAMIAGFVQSGNSMEALEFFKQMQQVGIKPDSKTFSTVLPACANLAALEQGMEIHEEIIRIGYQSDVFLENALVDMYAKCGSIERARELFDKMCEQNTVSWTVMIAGYAIHGCAKEALKLFEQMEHFRMWPDHVTLLCVLSACCHAGLVHEGRYHFNRMYHYYRIIPEIEHYSCMVDLLGRAGYLEEAQDFINRMPIKPDSTVWGSLLGACRLHNNVELGQCVAEWLFQLDPQNAAPYVLLANIYAGAGRWKEIQNLRKIMKNRKMKKRPGCSWIEVQKKMHAFIVGDGYCP